MHLFIRNYVDNLRYYSTVPFACDLQVHWFWSLTSALKQVSTVRWDRGNGSTYSKYQSLKQMIFTQWQGRHWTEFHHSEQRISFRWQLFWWPPPHNIPYSNIYIPSPIMPTDEQTWYVISECMPSSLILEQQVSQFWMSTSFDQFTTEREWYDVNV